MTNGETAYLALAIGAFVVYMILVAYGMFAAPGRPVASPQERELPKRTAMPSPRKAA